jgi:hypothetical protein
MKRLKSIILFLLINFSVVAQILDDSEIIKEARRYYFDSLVCNLNSDIKYKVLIFKEEMPENYQLTSNCFTLVTEHKFRYLEENNSKLNITSQVKIESISKSGEVTVSIHLERQFNKRKSIFSKKKIGYFEPLGKLKNGNYFEYLKSSYYKFYKYSYDCEKEKWILLPK